MDGWQVKIIPKEEVEYRDPRFVPTSPRLGFRPFYSMLSTPVTVKHVRREFMYLNSQSLANDVKMIRRAQKNPATGAAEACSTRHTSS